MTSVHQADSHINMGRAIEFEFESGETVTAFMSYGTFHDKISDQFTYEETLTFEGFTDGEKLIFPGDGRYTGPYVTKIYQICQECAHMTDVVLDDPIACIFC